jgi:hypothetical protein
LPRLVGGVADRTDLQLLRAIYLLHRRDNNRSDHLGRTGNELPQVPIATCLADRRNQILLTSQSSSETTSGLPPGMDDTKD